MIRESTVAHHGVVSVGLEDHYRTLGRRLALADGDEDGVPRTLGVTSSATGEGVTTVAINLAFTAADQSQRNVLLVDANLRLPRIHQLLELDAGPGLADVFLDDAALEDVVQDGPVSNFSVLDGRHGNRPHASDVQYAASNDAARRLCCAVRHGGVRFAPGGGAQPVHLFLQADWTACY